MKLAIKFCSGFWLIVIAVVLFSCSPHPVHAAPNKATFECSGEKITMSQQATNPIIMEIERDKGTWMQIPDNGNPKVNTTFYNLDSGKVAKIGKNYAGIYYLEFFKDVDYANAFKPERTLSCQIQRTLKYKP